MRADLQKLIEDALKSGDPEAIKLAYQYVSNPLNTFEPRPDRYDLESPDEQTSFVNDKFPGLACCIAGTAAGKSTCGAFKLAKLLYETPPPAKLTRIWVMSQTMKTAASVCWGEKLSKFIREEDIESVKWLSITDRTPETVRLKPHANGNQYLIEIGSYDMRRERLQGAGTMAYWLDELCPHDVLVEIRARCREFDIPGSQLYTLTPLVPHAELEDIYARQEDFEGWKFYRMNLECNKTLAKGYIENLIESTPYELRRTRMYGDFACFSGAIYPMFNNAAHVIAPFPIPDDWKRICGLDYGFNHETAMVYIARNSRGRYYVYNEYFQTEERYEPHAANMKKGWEGQRQPIIYSDTDPQAAKEYRHLGLSLTLADKRRGTVDVGINQVRQLMKIQADGLPNLLIFNTCTHVIEQLRRYIWNPKRPDEPKDDNADMCDALRYALFMDKRSISAIPVIAKPELRRFG